MARRTVTFEQLGTAIETRIRARLAKLQPKSPEMREALLRIGFLIESQAKANVRSKGLIDTGRLINSIQSEVFRVQDISGVRVGSFGVPYAAIHEFGGTIRAKNVDFLTIPLDKRFKGRQARDIEGLFPITRGNRSFLVRKEANGDLTFAYMLVRSVEMPKRPYLLPALRKTRPRVLEIIRELIRSQA